MKHLMKKITGECLVYFPYFSTLRKNGVKGFFNGSMENIEYLNNIDLDKHIEKVIGQKNSIEEIIYILLDEKEIDEKYFYVDKNNDLWVSLSSYDKLKQEVELEINFQKNLNYINRKKTLLKNLDNNSEFWSGIGIYKMPEKK